MCSTFDHYRDHVFEMGLLDDGTIYVNMLTPNNCGITAHQLGKWNGPVDVYYHGSRVKKLKPKDFSPREITSRDVYDAMIKVMEDVEEHGKNSCAYPIR